MHYLVCSTFLWETTVHRVIITSVNDKTQLENRSDHFQLLVLSVVLKRSLKTEKGFYEQNRAMMFML